MRVWPRDFAPILAFMMVLWPIMAYMGAQGFTASVSLGGLLAIPFLRFQKLHPYALIWCGFLLWTLALSVFGANAEAVFEGNLLEGNFGVNAPAARFATLILAGMGVMIACLQIPLGSGATSLRVSRVCVIVQGIGVLITAFFMGPIIGAILSTGLSDPASMLQNLLRNANAFALVLPLLLVWIWREAPARFKTPLVVSLVATLMLSCWLTGTQAGMLALLVMILFMAITKTLPRLGLSAIFTGLATYVMIAPVIIPLGVKLALNYGLPLPASFFSRAMGWQLVGEKISQAPLFGHGIEASYQWSELYSDHPALLAQAEARFGENMGWANYEILNSHPHNMPLQIWVETGFIGASLAALTLVFLGFRLQKVLGSRSESRLAAAALAGICAVICSVNYSMWNEAFWASVTIAAALLVLDYRKSSKRV